MWILADWRISGRIWAAIEVLGDVLDDMVDALVLMLEVVEELEEIIEEDDVLCSVEDGGGESVCCSQS